jgi:hypothetical protein
MPADYRSSQGVRMVFRCDPGDAEKRPFLDVSMRVRGPLTGARHVPDAAKQLRSEPLGYEGIGWGTAIAKPIAQESVNMKRQSAKRQAKRQMLLGGGNNQDSAKAAFGTNTRRSAAADRPTRAKTNAADRSRKRDKR